MLDSADAFALGILIAALNVPLVLGLVPRNPIYGFRVPSTMRSEHVWYEVNRRTGREMIVAGGAIAVVAGLFWTAGLESGAGRMALTALVLSACVTVIVRGWRYANHLARQAPRP